MNAPVIRGRSGRAAKSGIVSDVGAVMILFILLVFGPIICLNIAASASAFGDRHVTETQAGEPKSATR